MYRFLLDLPLRAKLLLAFGSVLLLSTLVVWFSLGSVDVVVRNKHVNEQVDSLQLHFNGLELALMKFMYEDFKSGTFLESGQAPAVSAFDDHARAIRNQLQTLRQTAGTSQDTMIMDQVSAALRQIHDDFRKLQALLRTRGFKDHGLEGELRKAIHDVENSGYHFDKAMMLTLRRHEKDFFLRRDRKYEKEFLHVWDEFHASVSLTSPDLLPQLGQYKKAFLEVVNLETEIGLQEKEGIRGKLRNAFASAREPMQMIRSQLKQASESRVARAQQVLWLVWIVQLVLGVSVSLIYAQLLSKPVMELKYGIESLERGEFPSLLPVHSREEFGQTKQAFNRFLDRLRSATDFAVQLGSGELANKKQLEANDVLATALNQMYLKLRDAEEKQQRIHWFNQGIARFHEVLTRHRNDFDLLTNAILKELIVYLGANQGALFVLEQEGHDSFLRRVATYAYGKRRFIEQRIDSGSGLLGQCVMEGQTIYLKEVPRDYVRITSGLGEAPPRTVLIVPLRQGEHIAGVIELGSFSAFESFHQELIGRLAENIASIIKNTRRMPIFEQSAEKVSNSSFVAFESNLS
jgi:HAMP domain-containing protein